MIRNRSLTSGPKEGWSDPWAQPPAMTTIAAKPTLAALNLVVSLARLAASVLHLDTLKVLGALDPTYSGLVNSLCWW